MSKFIELYKPYNELLIKELDIDWFQLQSTADKLGNGPGLYPDTAALLLNLVKLFSINNVLELGSGSSTVFLSKACSKFNKKFYSVEESPEYKKMTEALCAQFNVNENILLMKDVKWEEIPCPDLIFLDSDSSTREELLAIINNTSWNLNDVEVIVMDDSEYLPYALSFFHKLSIKNRFNNWSFNPIGRQDRISLINHKDQNFNLNEWFWKWKPDKVYW